MPYKDKNKQKEYQKRHYVENKEKYYERSKKCKAALYAKLENYKSNLSCLYCGKKHPAYMDFHHNREKTDTVANIIRRHSWDRTLEEIRKCDAVCANCHRKLHKTNGNQKYLENIGEQRRKREIIRWYNEYKSSLKCEICGEQESCCLDFHHEGEKDMIIARCAGHGWSKKRILEEISKCRVLCANCHRELHWNRKPMGDGTRLEAERV